MDEALYIEQILSHFWLELVSVYPRYTCFSNASRGVIDEVDRGIPNAKNWGIILMYH